MRYLKKIAKEKKDFESAIKIIDNELQIHFNNFHSIKIPNGLIKISEKQLERFPIRRIIIPNSVQCIEKKSINECFYLIEIDIPSSVKLIHTHSFCGCSNLTKIKIDPYSTEVQSGAFYGCKSLNNFIISPSNERLIIIPHKFNEYFERIGHISCLTFWSNILKNQLVMMLLMDVHH